ncbi:unnamed protein product [Staurois parvus]|uniref:Uncharacterized protein n=1 Tax=Staurois parvus TaxID=386267 RepID=A0ABN9H286_9NEOB|nr:unnamed protein product [Staurois parvus]
MSSHRLGSGRSIVKNKPRSVMSSCRLGSGRSVVENKPRSVMSSHRLGSDRSVVEEQAKVSNEQSHVGIRQKRNRGTSQGR